MSKVRVKCIRNSRLTYICISYLRWITTGGSWELRLFVEQVMMPGVHDEIRDDVSIEEEALLRRLVLVLD